MDPADAQTSTSSGQGLPVGGGSAAPAGAVPGATSPAGLETVPLELEFVGDFFNLADFFHDVKRFVRVAGANVVVGGRLITIESVNYSSDQSVFPAIKAELKATIYLSPKVEGATAGASPEGPPATTPASSPSGARRPRQPLGTHPDRSRDSVRTRPMKVFFLDLWHDLREKRLWPVALVLLLGLAAVPVILAKPAEDPGPRPPSRLLLRPMRRRRTRQLAQVSLEEGGAAAGSTLGVFDPANPFRPPEKIVKRSEEARRWRAEARRGRPDRSQRWLWRLGGDSDSGGADSGTTPPSSGGGGGTTPPSGGGTPTTTVYKYVVDVTFTANGRTRRIKGMEKLDMLPNQSSPLLIAMGVTADGGNAVFMVDSTLKAAGEGSCKPSGKECAFAYIGPGSEHAFTQEDGDSYTVRVDEIRKVKVQPGAVGARAGKAEGARANASVGSPRRFEPLMLADIVVVASDKLEDSNSDSHRR